MKVSNVFKLRLPPSEMILGRIRGGKRYFRIEINYEGTMKVLKIPDIELFSLVRSLSIIFISLASPVLPAETKWSSK